MGGVDHLLRRLRHAPEPLKRSLRPMLVRGVHLVRSLPGGRLTGRILRRLAPRLYSWVFRRYEYYTDSGLAREVVTPSPFQGADPDTHRMAQWLARGRAGTA